MLTPEGDVGKRGRNVGKRLLALLCVVLEDG